MNCDLSLLQLPIQFSNPQIHKPYMCQTSWCICQWRRLPGIHILFVSLQIIAFPNEAKFLSVVKTFKIGWRISFYVLKAYHFCRLDNTVLAHRLGWHIQGRHNLLQHSELHCWAHNGTIHMARAGNKAQISPFQPFW